LRPARPSCGHRLALRRHCLFQISASKSIDQGRASVVTESARADLVDSLKSVRLKESSARLIVLILTLLIIVGLAFLIRLHVTNAVIESVRWVAHTYEVKATVFELQSTLNDMEAAAFAAQFDPLSESAARRYGDARSRYAPLLEKLRGMTRDNPEQQERAGALRAQIEGRIELFDQAMLNRVQGLDSAAGTGLATAVTRFPVDEAMNAIVAEEKGLVERREREANEKYRIGALVVVGATLTQFLLLAGLIWASEKQLRRRLAAETIAHQAVERARLIVQTVREPIALLSADLKIITSNRAFTDYYKLDSSTKARSLDESPAWSDPALLQRLKDVALTHREIWDYELTQSTSLEQSRHVLVNARPLTLPDAAGTVTLLTVSDITARKQSEAQVLELNRQLEGKVAQISETNRELEAFSYSVSHDLRAPLRHIAGFTEKLRKHLGENADEQARHYSEVVMNASRHMSSLIEDLLTYSRLGRHAMRLQSVDMQALVDEVRMALTSNLEDDRNIDWRIAPLPVVVADENMMRLVWQNLLDNAIKYSAVREEAVIEVGMSEPSPTEWTFWVKDNGVGFNMAYTDKLFGVFQRLHKASQFAGTGIGLASVRRIVGRHGGRTWAEGVPEQGSQFFFSLPRNQNQG
jgi:signal transduction histidine kinase/CHASE3 domain sensor protein